ncbi:glutathione-disulfide reductase [Salaquimonas pukyongi]|uniref:glutathione-disulfide reductase n=1 Tax=Salaquimonas pukyongi TaxID=2712698 RepID=UPI00096B8069|nr:glutathione-disulfide reductase [Salaquimonas pukyongi]
MAQFDYDLFVIGGGSGGVRAGRVAASLGKRVGVAEESRFGGTCVIRGCVPKKLMVYASQYSKLIEDAPGYGWQVGESSFDWATLIANKDKEIARLEGLYRKGLDTNGADMIDSRAVVTGPNTVRIEAGGKEVSAETILVAVGGRPNPMKELAGHEHCIVSDDIFDLEALPASIVILGAGYIALEFACILSQLGSKVTVVLRGDEILRGFDMDVRLHLRGEMEKKGVTFITGAQFEKVEPAGRGREVTLTNGEVLKADQVLLAAGRLPNTDALGLEAAGVALEWGGKVVVDEYSRSSVPSICAVGDVTDRVQLTPVAIHEAMCLIETLYKDNPTMPDHELVATAVFTQPEVGTIGMSEEEAAEKCRDLDVYKSVFRPMKYILPGRDEKMLMKIIAESATGKVVGVHLVGPDSGEMAQLLGISLKMGARKEDFDRTMAVHPTAAEELVTLYSPSYHVRDGKRVD